MKILINNLILSADNAYLKINLNALNSYTFHKDTVIRVTSQLNSKQELNVQTKSILKFVDLNTNEKINITTIDTNIGQYIDSKVIKFNSEKTFNLEMPVNCLDDDFSIIYTLEVLDNYYMIDLEI